MDAHFVSGSIYGAPGYPANHPLAIQRVGTVEALCRLLGWTGSSHPVVLSPVADPATLHRFHRPDYLDAIRRSEAAGLVSPGDRARYNIGTLENPVFPGLFERAATSVGGSIRAAELVAGGGIAYHPAGGTHHGMPDRANGFCFMNDPVFAILELLDQGLARVLYVDLDAHHGDGVEAAFRDEPRVMTVSVHEAGRWPGTGRAEDRGAGRARNFPVPRAMTDAEFAFLMSEAVLPVARDFAPDAVVVVMGADALAGDPLSSLALSNGALWDAVEALVAAAPRAVVLGGGGYNPWTLARAWAGVWARLTGQPIPDRLPAEAEALLRGLDCDLVDEEDRPERWFTNIADPAQTGPVRPEFEALVRAHRAPARAQVLPAPARAHMLTEMP